MRKHLTPENAEELFELCSNHSMRKVEELLAARFPRCDVRDLVRRLPSRAGATLDVERSTALPVTRGHSSEQLPQTSPSISTPATELESASIASPLCEPSTDQAKVPAESQFPAPSVASVSLEAGKTRRFEPLSAGRFGVHFTANEEFCALLERVRGLAGHRLPSGDLMTLLKRALEAYERELEKERFAIGRQAHRKRKVTPSSNPSATCELSSTELASAELSSAELSSAELSSAELSSAELSSPEDPRPAVYAAESSKLARPTKVLNPKRRRRCSAAVVRAVFLRDGKRCSYVSPDGRRCSACRCLELDHIVPFAVGGADTIENLRLRCRAHNQWYARRYFGVFRGRAAVSDSARRQRKRCAESSMLEQAH